MYFKDIEENLFKVTQYFICLVLSMFVRDNFRSGLTYLDMVVSKILW